MRTRLIVLGLALLPLVGCDRSSPEAAQAVLLEDGGQASDTGRSPVSETAADDPEAVLEAADRLARTVPDDSAREANGQPAMGELQPMAQGAVRLVDFEQLRALLPAIDGWRQTDARGEQLSLPVAYSRAEAVYHRDDSRLELEITDTALNELLLAPVSMFISPGFSERSAEGFKRAVSVSGQPGLEEWDPGSNRGEVTAVVGGRFIVSAKGRDVADLEAVRRAVESIDFGRLTAFR